MQTSTAGGLFVFLKPCQGTGGLFVHIRTDATGLAGSFGVYTPKGRIAGASRAFVYTNAILLCKMLVGEVPQAPLICIFRCRLRIPAGCFLPGDAFRVVEDLHEVRSGLSQRSILHLFRDRRIQK